MAHLWLCQPKPLNTLRFMIVSTRRALRRVTHCGTLSVETHSILSQSTRALSLWARAPHPVRCAAFFVRSEKSNALVGDGFPQPAPRSANLDSAFGGMQLFATEAWRAAPLLLTHSAQLTQPTVRLPQL